jgi:hypothetical protein
MRHTHTYIYGLLDPEDLIIKYIGQTVNPIARLGQHLKDNNWLISNKHDWINKLLSKGTKPYILIFERVVLENASMRETEFINKFKDTIFNTFKEINHPVVNTNRSFKKGACDHKRKTNYHKRGK